MMESLIVKRDNASPIVFNGEKIASTSSTPDRFSMDYSQRDGEWTMLTIYRTDDDQYVCHQGDYTQHVGHENRASGCVCKTIDEVVGFFGAGWLARRLYRQLKLVPISKQRGKP